MLKEAEQAIIDKIKEITDFRTVKAYEDEFTKEIDRLIIIAPFALVFYLGRRPEILGNEYRILFKYRIVIGEKSYNKDNARIKALELLEKVESKIRDFAIDNTFEPLRHTNEALMYSDDKFSVYYQDYEAFKYN